VASDQRATTPTTDHRRNDRRRLFRGVVLGGVSGLSIIFQNNRYGGLFRNHTEEDLDITVTERAEVISGAFSVVCASLPQTVISERSRQRSGCLPRDLLAGNRDRAHNAAERNPDSNRDSATQSAKCERRTAVFRVIAFRTKPVLRRVHARAAETDGFQSGKTVGVVLVKN
jgi:hypothetical protein